MFFIYLTHLTVLKQTAREESLQQWYLKYIDYFRQEYEKLSVDEKKSIGNTNNFLNPCQIEVFWITDPDYQLIVQSNFSDRPDKEIIINGPYKPYEFHSNVIPILKEKRWTRNVKQTLPTRFEQFDTLGERMAFDIYRFTEMCKNDIFTSEKRDHCELLGMAIEGTWMRTCIGNIGELDHILEINNIVQKIKQATKASQKTKPILQQPKSSVSDKYMGFGVHLFPPIVIGSKYTRSIDELVYNTPNHWMYNKVLDIKINNKQIIVYKDGFIFVEGKNQENALKFLNLIMAYGAFYNFPLYAVREHELAMANYDKQDLHINSMQWNPETRRAYILDPSFNSSHNIFAKTNVPLETIQEILLNTEKLLTDEKLSEDMRLLNEGLTHLTNSEFAQSFIMSWSIIERHYSDTWFTLLSQRNIDHERSSKLNNPNQWSIDYVLEVLELEDKINENSYDLLMELKRKRNKFYHNGKQMTKDDADRCLQYARKLLVDKISPHVSLSRNLMLSKTS